jgi:elongation of very long chain fatty acids protein 7
MSTDYVLTSPPLISNLDILSYNQCINETIETSLISSTDSLNGMSVWHYFLYYYWQKEGDPRSKHLPMMSGGPIPVIIIMSIYFVFVTVIGPKIMSKRPAFVLRGPMFAYNILMVVLNAYFFCKFVLLSDFGREFTKFEFPTKADQSLRSKILIQTVYYYFLTKFVDLLDTIFFVLRKKNNQITGLHLYHHTVVPLLGWSCMKIAPTVPPFQIFGILNSLVHVIMYSYYGLSSFGPSIQPYLWWKRYITQIQLTQFVILIIYGLVLAAFQTGYPVVWFYFGQTQCPLFFYLFYDFYRQSYKKIKTSVNKKLNNL